MNNNMFNQPQIQPANNGYFTYPYQAAMPTQLRPDASPYMMPMAPAPAYLKGRPVSSLEEARAAQIDLDGSLFVFPDIGNKKIYTKKINLDGTATVNSYALEPQVQKEEPEVVKFATKEEMQDLKKTLDDILAKLNKPIEKTSINF